MASGWMPFFLFAQGNKKAPHLGGPGTGINPESLIA